MRNAIPADDIAVDDQDTAADRPSASAEPTLGANASDPAAPTVGSGRHLPRHCVEAASSTGHLERVRHIVGCLECLAHQLAVKRVPGPCQRPVGAACLPCRYRLVRHRQEISEGDGDLALEYLRRRLEARPPYGPMQVRVVGRDAHGQCEAPKFDS